MLGATSPAEPANTAAEPAAPRPGANLAEIVLPKVLHLASVVGKSPFFIAWGTPDSSLLHPLIERGIAGLDIGLSPAAGALLPATADAHAGIAAEQRFDLVLLSPGAPAQDLAELIAKGRARPACIYMADKAALVEYPSLLATLQAENYMLLAQFAGAEIYLDGVCMGAAPKRAAINSFDVFDTLIARRCVEPHRIFEMVEASSKIAGFAQRRRSAETRLAGRDYTIDDIYDELVRVGDVGTAEVTELKALELALELENVIPIAENLRLVTDGDLLISDMYLGEPFIRMLLEKAGLKKQIGLFVSPRGKHSGAAWRQISADFEIRQHVGDNPRADIEMPRRFGISTHLTKASAFELVEETLDKIGLRDLARLSREARLSCWDDDPRIRAAQCLQTGVNFPLLLLASVALARKATTLSCDTLLFCSRDCNQWLPLFDALQEKLGTALRTKYFLTSRVARKKGSDSYLQYAKDNIGAGSLVVDLCGTGWSMAILAERIGLSACNIFLLHHLAPFPIYEQWKPTPASCVVHSLFDVRPRVQEARILELANMADHGMVVDMQTAGTAMLPVLAKSELNEIQSGFLRAQRAAFDSAVRRLDHYRLRDVFELDDGSIQAVSASLLEFLSKQTPCFELFWNDFVTEDKAIMRELRG